MVPGLMHYYQTAWSSSVAWSLLGKRLSWSESLSKINIQSSNQSNWDFPRSVVTLDQYEMILTGPLGRTV